MMFPRSRRCPRTQTLIGWLGLALLVVFAACSDSKSGIAGPEPDTPPTLEISDAAHGGSTDGFYFLAPLVSSPPYSGTFDATLSPTVHICEGATVSCEGAEVALFTTETGPGSETVRVDETEEHYVVNWHTDEFDLHSDVAYRISVRVAGTLLGYADVMPASNGAEMKNIDGAENIPLKDGRTLPVKFRIEAGTVFPVGSSGGRITAEDGAVVLEIPEGALSEEVGITIESGGSVASGIGLVSGTVYDFQPDGLQFSEPASLTLAFSLPDGLSASDVAILDELESGEWNELVSSVDASANTVTAPIDGFSRKGVGKRADDLEITPAAAQLDLTDNTTAQFSATVRDANDAELTKRKVRWSVGDEAVAKVDKKDGVVTAVGDGTTYVEAKAGQASDQADVTVGANEPPTAQITSPADGATFDEGETITFEGSGSDPEDGTLTDASLVWTSDLDGQLGTGTSVSTSLSVETHTVTLTATDSDGATASETIRVTIDAAPAGAGGVLVNVSPDGVDVTNDQIFRVSPDGSEVVALTGDDPDDPDDEFFARGWSPDGREILYSDIDSRDSGAGDLYRMNRDGSGKTQLTDSPYFREGDASWSPAGDLIAFWRRPTLVDASEIYVMNPDGSGLQRLTNNQLRERQPVWSPTGDQIAFVRRSHNGERYVHHIVKMKVDGTGQVELTSGASSNTHPVWSPAGDKIAFYSDRDDVYQSCALHVMNADGSGLVRLLDPTPAQCGSTGENATWSPDGTRLAVLRTPDGDPLTPAEIWVVAADGSGAVNVTNDGPARDYDPVWSPDGTRIIYGSNPNDRTQAKLYIINADGTNDQVLADPGSVEMPVEWQ